MIITLFPYEWWNKGYFGSIRVKDAVTHAKEARGNSELSNYLQDYYVQEIVHLPNLPQVSQFPFPIPHRPLDSHDPIPLALLDVALWRTTMLT